MIISRELDEGIFSDQPELDEYVALLIAKDSAPSAYLEEVERFCRRFPESPLAAYLKIREEGVSGMDIGTMETDSEFAELFFARGSSLFDEKRFQRGGDLLPLGLTLIPDHTFALPSPAASVGESHCRDGHRNRCGACPGAFPDFRG